MEKSEYTKESIKVRMFERIMKLWNIRSIDAIDPVLKLLVESLAAEVFKLSGELDDVESRIVDRLAVTFVPSSMMSASPAHAIVHTRCAEGSLEINTDTEFVYKDPRFIQKYNLRKMSFTPIKGGAVINGDVVRLICDGKFYEVSPRNGKDHSANSIRRDPLFNHTVWIGLEVAPGVKTLKDLTFYADFPLMEDNEEHSRLLSYGRWFHEGRNLQTSTGLFDGYPDDAIFGQPDQHTGLRDDIAGKYHYRFIRLREELRVGDLKRESIPGELSHLFDESTVQGLRDDIIWLKVVFPPALFDVLDYMVVHINCFPVVNVYKKQTVVVATPLSSIIPIDKAENEYFLFMDSITDSDGKEYKQVHHHEDNTTTGTYMVRRGGSERFNALDAQSFLERLLDVYRDESIAFSGIDKDVTDTTEGFMSHLSAFEKKLHSYSNDSEHASYLILGSEITGRLHLHLCYNLTNGAVANQIRMFEPLETPDFSDIVPQSTLLMTTTRGGRKSPPDSIRKDLYQYLLTTRDRIYTREDIRLFCRSHFGDSFTDVKVEKGYEVSRRPNQGFIRITKVILQGVKLSSQEDVRLLERDMLAGLEQRSPEDIEYRIVIE